MRNGDLPERFKEIVAGKRKEGSPWFMNEEVKAVASAGIMKRVTPHTLRHAFTTHSLQNGNDIATVSDLLGHERLETTAIYAHGDAALGVSPLDVTRQESKVVRFPIATGWEKKAQSC